VTAFVTTGGAVDVGNLQWPRYNLSATMGAHYSGLDIPEADDSSDLVGETDCRPI
jgi:hypothetical protein